jgi:hypothetical protein
MSAGIPGGAKGPIEVGGRPFDPLGLAKFRDFDEMSKAEVRNGRVAMLASVGWVWPQIFGTFDAKDVTTVDPIAAISQVDPVAWIQIFLLMGVNEVLDFQHDWSKGALWDPLQLLPKDPVGKAQMMEKELKHGRLGMLAFASFLAAHYIPGSVPLLPANFV